MSRTHRMRCIACGQVSVAKADTYLCEACGGNQEWILDPAALEGVTRESIEASPRRDMWRYAPLLPIENLDRIPPVSIGWTPLYHAETLGKRFGLKRCYVKDDGRNPSASFKDRASAVALVRALEVGAEKITGASTGNAGSSMACLCASMGIRPVIFVPEKAPKAKITQLLIFGAQVVAVKGTYDQAFDLCLEATKKYGWYNRNTGFNPFTREGKKTAALEIAEQFGWDVPEWVVVSVGDGNILSGLHKGFRDLKELGWIDRLPRLAAIQAEGSSAVVRAFQGDGTIEAVSASTVADSISVDLPRDGMAAVRALRESEGLGVLVSDEEILDAIPLLARSQGIFAEPAGAAAIAGLKKMSEEGLVQADERVVCMVTGNGLKDVDSAIRVAGTPLLIEPTLEAVEAAGIGA